MIYGKVAQIERYKGIHPNVDKAINWIVSEMKLEDAPLGVTKIDGDDVYVNRFDYTTQPAEELLFEAHEKYADVHLLLSGEEAIHVSDVVDLVEEKREVESDYIGCSGESQCVCLMRPGYFLLVFPEDAHKVKASYQKETAVQKAVVKIKM